MTASDRTIGERLIAFERHDRLVSGLKYLAVWIGLITILAIILLQLRVDPGYLVERTDIVGIVLTGLVTTVFVSLAAILFATILALLGALGRVSTNALANGISGFYVSVLRGTPLLIQIYLIYLGLPQIGVQLREMGLVTIGNLLILPAIVSGILALSLNYGAYMTEIFRAGLQSISHGQWEAAEALGMTRWQILRRVILPQAVRIIIPDIGNQFIAMQKDSALVSVMGVWELTFLANRSARLDSRYMELFIFAAFLYWLLTIASSWVLERVEKRMSTAYER